MRKLVVFIALVGMAGCKSAKQPEPDIHDLSQLITRHSEIMIHDITNPPLAARFFAYACLSGYSIAAQHDTSLPAMHGKLRDFPAIQKPDSIEKANWKLAALLAIAETAKKMQPSGNLLQEWEDNYIDSLTAAGYAEDMINASLRYATFTAKQVLAYAKADGYNKISNFPRYSSSNTDSSWFPTPPGYIAAVEPYFNSIRPFTLDSARQFRPQQLEAFKPQHGSAFYAMMMEVYADSADEEHKAIAGFWDCNPFAVQDKGHLQYSIKKISPGAHWMGITGIACEKAGKSFAQSLQAYTTVAIGLTDAFICCWDEKYRTNRIRPETAIRRYIDPNWMPLLQTPPFPEYLSGHSVVSAASAAILTHYFGDNFAYTDSVEVKYDLPPRHFKSFKAASREAGISRLYGGIHFMDAINNGLTQGDLVGEWVLQKTK
ncbi:MAG: vanadium-dependent haloperoxidase [Bacteroidetes bacterium]|nr:vanadium-dependent haloperoxidase [Bacteroidota bacterium]